jgi:hypothetical protein
MYQSIVEPVERGGKVLTAKRPSPSPETLGRLVLKKEVAPGGLFGLLVPSQAI